MQPNPTVNSASGIPFRAILGVFKLRIGVVITFTALAGLAVSSGPSLSLTQLIVLTLSVLVSSASAGAFNQYYEKDLDPKMARTSKRPFVTGELKHGPLWLFIIISLMVLSVGSAWIALNAWSALYVFLGAFFYAVVYTVWLKRRTWLNIVFGGLAGSWAVLAGATAADPNVGAVPLSLAFVLFLWTPPHFWSLACYRIADYEKSGLPMLPVTHGIPFTTQHILLYTVMMAAATLIPVSLGMSGWFYLVSVSLLNIGFIGYAVALRRNYSDALAKRTFRYSIIYLTLLFAALFADRLFV